METSAKFCEVFILKFASFSSSTRLFHIICRSCNYFYPVAVLRGVLRGPCPPRFLAGSLLSPPVLCLISRSSLVDWHIQQITFSQQNFELFENGSDDIHKPMLGFIGLIIANQSSLQRKLVPIYHYIGRLYALISSTNHAHYTVLRLINFSLCDVA